MQSFRIPNGWLVSGNRSNEYDIGVDPEITWEGQATVGLVSKTGEDSVGSSLYQVCLADAYRGTRVRFSGRVRAVNVAEAAMLMIAVHADRSSKVRPVTYDFMENRPIRGNTDWLLHELVVDVPTDALSIRFGATIKGPGGMWLSDLAFESVGEDVPLTCDFEDDSNPSMPSNLSFTD